MLTLRPNGVATVYDGKLGGKPSYANLPEIHNSDAALFLRCRRKWNWQSTLRAGLETIDVQPAALWFGTGFHFAMEDYHGYRQFKTPMDAFLAYVNAFDEQFLPPNYEELISTASGMLEYYEQFWLPKRHDFDTLWINDVPQVEVNFILPIPRVKATYAGTLDRVVVDSERRLWVLDYKTAAKFDSEKWANDSQIGRYTWAARELYGRDFEGCVWQQHIKALPERPKELKDGGFSKDRRQHTTAALYRAALLDLYEAVPSEYIEHLNWLISQESEEGDRYIRRDLARRNVQWAEAEKWKLHYLAKDMISPRTALYPNPTRDCSWDCPFRQPCIALDDGADFASMLEYGYQPRQELGEWRKRVKWGEEPKRMQNDDFDLTDWLTRD